MKGDAARESAIRKQFVVRYSALPRWFLPAAATVCLLSGSLWLSLKTGLVPDLSGFHQSIVAVEERHDPSFELYSRSQYVAPGGPGQTAGEVLDTSDLVFGSSAPNKHFLAPSAGTSPAVRALHLKRLGLEVRPPELPGFIPGATPLDRILFVLFGIWLASGLLTLVGRDTKLSLSGEGLTFPSGMMPELKFRRKRKWSDISILTVPEPESSKSAKRRGVDRLQLYFASGGKATLDLSSMDAGDLELFFLGIDEWGSQTARSPEVVALRHQLFDSKAQGSRSHTNIWEDELASHFAATNFVALSPGQTLQSGRLKVVMHLFSGGLSAVYLAERAAEVVVVKESVVPVTTDEPTREKAREMFRREAALLMELDHPQIARVLDHFVENGRDYLMLEYIPGMTLREYVKRHGKQSEEVVVTWAEQIADILAYLHSRNPPVLHRDLTPDNLILTPEGKVVLIDFGAANQFIGQATGTIVGKQLYIAPEQFRGKAEPASDIYSLGATLHYLLTGIEPEALAQSIPSRQDSLIGEDMSALVAACTEQEAEARIRSAREFLQRLQELRGVKIKLNHQDMTEGTESKQQAESVESPGSKTDSDEGCILAVPHYEGQL